MIKGRQTGAMHRGHSWIFRAESYETMLAWYDDIQALTEKTGEERNAFVRKHARSFSGNSKAGSDSGLEEDEADEVPYSANASLTNQKVLHEPPAQMQRPQPGRFPSELSNNQSLNRHLQPPLSPSSGSSLADQDLTTPSGGLHGSHGYATGYGDHHNEATTDIVQPTPIHPNVASFQHQERDQLHDLPVRNTQYQVPVSQVQSQQSGMQPDLSRHDSNYQSWMAPTAGAAAVGASTVIGKGHGRDNSHKTEERQDHSVAANTTHGNEREPKTRSPQNTIAPTIDHTDPELSSAFTARADTAPSVATPQIPVGIASPAEVTPSPAAFVQPIPEVYVPRGAASTIPEAKTSDSDGKTSVFPAMSRQNTDNSISNLHIPGEYPKGLSS
jgi:hypothetical protein